MCHFVRNKTLIQHCVHMSQASDHNSEEVKVLNFKKKFWGLSDENSCSGSILRHLISDSCES